MNRVLMMTVCRRTARQRDPVLHWQGARRKTHSRLDRVRLRGLGVARGRAVEHEGIRRGAIRVPTELKVSRDQHRHDRQRNSVHGLREPATSQLWPAASIDRGHSSVKSHIVASITNTLVIVATEAGPL
jgi:hypothetical protein